MWLLMFHITYSYTCWKHMCFPTLVYNNILYELSIHFNKVYVLNVHVLMLHYCTSWICWYPYEQEVFSLCQIHSARKLIWCERHYYTVTNHCIWSEHMMCSFCMIRVCEILRRILLNFISQVSHINVMIKKICCASCAWSIVYKGLRVTI